MSEILLAQWTKSSFPKENGNTGFKENFGEEMDGRVTFFYI